MHTVARIIPGQAVLWQGRTHVVLDVSGLDRAVVRDLASGHTESAPTAQLTPDLVMPEQPPRQDLMLIPDEDWKEAWRRYELIRPLLELGVQRLRSEQDVRAVAQAVGKDPVTIYRWMSRYEETGFVSSLIRPPRADRGQSRLDPAVDAIVTEVIHSVYLNEQRPSTAETCLEIARRCHTAGIKPPHHNTVRARIAQISERVRITKRHGHKAARERFDPIKGAFPGAEVPLAVVQIDHTPVDLTLVDDAHRLPIGRPYLTLAIDVYTRMIAGFYVTLDPPGAMSAGLCIANAILPKEEFLASKGISTAWPIWGKMRKIHVDNAKEFRGTMLERACHEHGITLEHRPKGQPNYGGHIERAFLTFMRKAHTVPGTTFSDIDERGDYDADRHACMTLDEFERWFATFVVEVYHQRAHRGISDVPPIKLYEQSILGTPERPGVGLPLRVPDERKLRLDFTPFVERTIQEYGVAIDNIHYYADTLRRWIHARDPGNAKLKRKFIFARDPRNVSVVHFLDPDTRTYAPIPYRDARRPAISLWELKAAIKRAEDEGWSKPNEEIIFEGIRKMRELERDAVAKTKQARAARRSAQRRRSWNGTSPVTDVTPLSVATSIDPFADYPGGDVTPFSDIEEG